MRGISIGTTTAVVVGTLVAVGGIEILALLFFGNRPAVPWLFLTSAGLSALAVVFVVRVRRFGFWKCVAVSLLASIGAAGTLAAGQGPVARFGMTTVLEPALLHLETASGARRAAQRFESGHHQLLAFSMSELMLAGATDENRTCQVIYVENPTEAQIEGLTEQVSSFPARPACIPPGSDAVACLDANGRLRVFATQLVVAGCLIEPSDLGYNERMVDLLLETATVGSNCGLDISRLPRFSGLPAQAPRTSPVGVR